MGTVPRHFFGLERSTAFKMRILWPTLVTVIRDGIICALRQSPASPREPGLKLDFWTISSVEGAADRLLRPSDGIHGPVHATLRSQISDSMAKHRSGVAFVWPILRPWRSFTPGAWAMGAKSTKQIDR